MNNQEVLIINDDPSNESPVFNGLAFLSKIEDADTLSKKVQILNFALRQEAIGTKNMMAEMKKKGLNAGAAQDYDYVPVGVIEEALRQVFFRQIDFEIKQSFRDLNSFVVIASIKYKCPISQEYRVIDGIGAKALQQDAGAKIHDFNLTMKANALELGVGIAYSRAIKNAAKKLGKLFGANLNRDEEMDNVLVFNKSVMEKAKTKEDELSGLYAEKKEIIPADEFDNITRIVNNKEKTSYDKAIKYLKTLK